MKNLGTALLEAQKAMPRLALDATNPHYGSRFVSLPKLLETIRPVLGGAGLILAQHPTTLDGEPALRTQIIHAETGEFIEDTMPLMLSKPDAQGQGSALTYARRYAILAVLGLAGEEDDDGQAAVDVSRSGKESAVYPEKASTRGAPRGLPVDSTPLEAAARAQQAQQTQPVPQQTQRVPPDDNGNPADVAIHFGKNKGQRLGDLTQRQVKWYAETWKPSPQFESPADRRLKLAAEMLAGLG